MRLRKLNDRGLREFEAWIEEGAPSSRPQHLLTDPATSSPFTPEVRVPRNVSGSRYDFGAMLVQLFAELDPVSISHDRFFWTSLALLWFDQICPPFSTGRRVNKPYHYILSEDYRHYYRHLVRSPWQLVRDHGTYAKLLLLPPRDNPYPLRIHGEVLEQLGGRQSVLRSRALIEEANRLFADKSTGRPRKGVAGSGRGSARRLGLVLRQFDLTYDVENMPDGRLVRILPREFDRWRAKEVASAT
jgi:hypothetical protein